MEDVSVRVPQTSEQIAQAMRLEKQLVSGKSSATADKPAPMKPSEALQADFPGVRFAEIGLEMLDWEIETDRQEYREAEALAALPELLDELRRSRAPAKSKPDTVTLPAVPTSLARAAKLLGVSKTRTLLPAIAAGAVCTIKQGKRLLIPPGELRRLAAEGIVAVPTPRRRRRMVKPPGPRDISAEAAAVRALRQR